VLKQISPVVVPSAPNDSPRNTRPSSNASNAIMRGTLAFAPPREKHFGAVFFE
jgi:hypothetical protein